MFCIDAGCTPKSTSKPANPPALPTILQIQIVHRESTSHARYTVQITEGNRSRTFLEEDFRFPTGFTKDFRISSEGELAVRAEVDGDNPVVHGEANAHIPLKADLYMRLHICTSSPEDKWPLNFCRYTPSRAFPLYGPGQVLLRDSLVIHWENSLISRPSRPWN